MELSEAQRQIERRQREEDRSFRLDAIRFYLEAALLRSGMPGVQR